MSYTLPRDASTAKIPYLANLDNNSNPAIPTEQYILVNGVYQPVSESNPLPTQLTGSNATIGQVEITSSTGAIANTAGSYTSGDNTGLGDTALNVASNMKAFNGNGGFDRWRNNTQGTLLASAARTVTTSSPTQTNYNARGVIVTLNVTAASGTGGLQLDIMGYDPVTNTPYHINNAPTAVTATGIYTYVVYPGANGGNPTQTTSQPLPRSWYAFIYVNDASSYTYSVGYALIN